MIFWWRGVVGFFVFFYYFCGYLRFDVFFFMVIFCVFGNVFFIIYFVKCNVFFVFFEFECVVEVFMSVVLCLKCLMWNVFMVEICCRCGLLRMWSSVRAFLCCVRRCAVRACHAVQVQGVVLLYWCWDGDEFVDLFCVVWCVLWDY